MIFRLFIQTIMIDIYFEIIYAMNNLLVNHIHQSEESFEIRFKTKVLTKYLILCRFPSSILV